MEAIKENSQSRMPRQSEASPRSHLNCMANVWAMNTYAVPVIRTEAEANSFKTRTLLTMLRGCNPKSSTLRLYTKQKK